MSDEVESRQPAVPVDVFITRRIPRAGEMVLLERGVSFEVGQHDDERGLSRPEVLEGVARCKVLLPLLTEAIDREVLRTPGLLGVANMAVGFDNVDIGAATELGVPVSNTPGVLTETTADLTWALILGVARRLPQAHQYLTSGRYRIWGPNSFLGADAGPGGRGARKVLGVVGFGRIGQAVARRALGFGMEVIAHDPGHRARIERSELAAWAGWEELLEQSDFVSLHAPLMPETLHLIGAAELEAMKTTAFLINTARGPIVDEEALVEALREGWIAGAGLDVYEREPILADGLAELENVVLLPHIGSASADTRGLMAAMAAENAISHLRRERAPNVVNARVYSTDAYRRRIGS